MASKPQSTKIYNTQLKQILKLIDTYCIKVEDGAWDVEGGTYEFIKRAGQHVRCEMAKQSRQTRKTMRINVVEDPDRQIALSRKYQDNDM